MSLMKHILQPWWNTSCNPNLIQLFSENCCLTVRSSLPSSAHYHWASMQLFLGAHLCWLLGRLEIWVPIPTSEVVVILEGKVAYIDLSTACKEYIIVSFILEWYLIYIEWYNILLCINKLCILKSFRWNLGRDLLYRFIHSLQIKSLLCTLFLPYVQNKVIKLSIAPKLEPVAMDTSFTVCSLSLSPRCQ